MDKPGNAKNQHYVPQFLLRKFSRDELHISLVALAEGRRVDGAKITKQCKGRYFYGSDQVMERSFADEELKISKHLSDLSPEHLDTLPPSALEELRTFAYYQQARTRGAAQHVSAFVGAFAKSILRDHIKLNRPEGLRPEDVDLVEVGIKNAQDESIWLAAKAAPLMRDMAVKFVLTARTVGFVISDHPVVAYNQFVEHHPSLRRYPQSTALAHKGLQFFLPLSPSITLAVYDPSTYEYGGKSRVCRAGPDDVRALNEMQAVNAWECVYFDPERIEDGTLEGLRLARGKHPSRYCKVTRESELSERPDGGLSKTVDVGYTDLRIGAKLTFIRTTDGHTYQSYDEPDAPIRSPQLLALTIQLGERLEKIVAERRAAAVATAQQGDPDEARSAT